MGGILGMCKTHCEMLQVRTKGEGQGRCGGDKHDKAEIGITLAACVSRLLVSKLAWLRPSLSALPSY